MCRAVVLFTICLVAVYAVPTENEKKCMKLRHDVKRCCVRDTEIVLERDDSIKECMQLPMRSSACERHICIAMKKGFASEDGKIDKDALKQVIEKDLKADPALTKLIVDNCVDADISKYGPADMCDIMKMHRCLDLQFVTSCPKWDNEGPCSGKKELATECVEKFA